MCGLSREVCRDPANQFQFVASAEQCHASYAIALAQGKQSDQSDAQNRAISWSAYLRH